MNNKKPLIAIALILLGGIVGGTFAYFTTTNSFENVFSTKPYGTEVTETFESPENWTPGTETTKTVVAKNTGDVDIAVRVSYTEEWESTDETALSGTLTNGERAAILNFDNTTDWTKEGNYYYYNKKLGKGETTTSFLKSVTFNPNTPSDLTCTETTEEGGVKKETCTTTGKGYDGATYTLTINVETIQFDAYKTSWNPTLTITDTTQTSNP